MEGQRILVDDFLDYVFDQAIFSYQLKDHQ